MYLYTVRKKQIFLKPVEPVFATIDSTFIEKVMENAFLTMASLTFWAA